MKIDVRQVLTEAAASYKESFKKVAGIASVNLILLISMQFMQYALPGADSNPFLLLFLSLVMLVGMVAAIVVMPRLYLAMLILIHSLFENTPVRFRDAYRETKSKYWITMGCFLLAGLCYSPGIVLIMMRAPFSNYISTIFISFITPLFFTLFPMIALEPKTNCYLRKSLQLIQGNYKAALLLTYITATLWTLLNMLVLDLCKGYAAATFLVSMLNPLVNFFLTPFVVSVTIIVYRTLRRSN